MDTDILKLSLCDQPNVYHTVNISGNAHAILGNIDNFSLSQGSNVDWKNTLKVLYFEGMRTRRAQIAQRASSPKYVAWVWKTKFVDWLCNNDSFFWVTGRAGSGKSTLMKHIADSRKTKQYLERNGEKWTVVHFFFDFRAGSSTANNLEGMLRSMLYQIVQQCPNLAHNIDLTAHDEFQTLSVVSCLDYICQATDAASSRICAFIDGLDEFDGSGAHLVETIHELEDRAGFKLCLASRPYQLFESNFSRYANLTVQEHNDESIQMYVQAQWKNTRLGIQASLPEAFRDKLRKKAGGVFLWARLAIDELLQDLLCGKTLTDLEAQLDEMPKEVGELYQRILDRVPAIMRLETATLLYMITSSSSIQDVQIRMLYIALDAYTRTSPTGGVAQTLPIDLGDEVGLNSRIVNVLGDFVDISICRDYCGFKYSADDGIDGRVPIVSIQKNELKLLKGPFFAVSLTHETLRAFLRDNAWITSYMVPELRKLNPVHLWLDVYLSEMEDAPLAGTSEACEVYSVILDYTQPACITEADDIDPAGEKLLTCLRKWPGWTPLLLLSVQYLLREVANHIDLDSLWVKRVGLALQNPVMRYHLAICGLQGRFLAANDFFYKVKCRSLWIDNCAHSFPHRLYHHADIVGWDILFSVCHGLPELALHSRLLEEQQSETVIIQDVFDHTWTKFINGPHQNTHSLLFDRLIDAGARFNGPHFCSLMQCYSPRGRDSLARMIRSVSSVVLVHADDCDLGTYEGDSASFLWHWANFCKYSPDEAPSDTLVPLLNLLLRSGVQINASFQDEPLLNMLLTDEKDSLCYMVNRMEKFITALKAGADPRLVGSHGNALQAARNLSSLLNCPPEDHWLNNLDRDPGQRNTNFQTQQLEVVKIIEMLEEYTEMRSFTETQFEPYARSNSSHPMYYKSPFLQRLDPYRLFNRIEHGTSLV